MEPTEALRMAERLLVTMFGGLSIFLGYRLFLSGVLKVSSAEWEGLGLRMKITRASPGLFFAAFGCIILWTSIHGNVQVESIKSEAALTGPSSNIDSPELVTSRSFIGALNTRDYDRMIASLNLAIVSLSSSESAKVIEDLQSLRQLLLRSAFGDSDYEFYESNQSGDLEHLRPGERAKWFVLDRRATRIPGDTAE